MASHLTAHRNKPAVTMLREDNRLYRLLSWLEGLRGSISPLAS
jgi:hypothetical protein